MFKYANITHDFTFYIPICYKFKRKRVLNTTLDLPVIVNCSLPVYEIRAEPNFFCNLLYSSLSL
jgi:hypothetical protein